MNLKESKSFYAVVAVVLTSLAFLFGQGILMKPKVSISCGAIDYKIPAKYQMELFTWKMMMLSEDLAKQIPAKIASLLREYGFPEEKIKLVIENLQKKGGKPIDLHLKLNEENIIKAVVAKLNAELLPETMMKSLQLPDAALFFEIKNSGLAPARNAHIVIRLNGTAYNVEKDSENKLKDSVEKGSELTFDYEQIAPDSKIKGIVWYSHVKTVDTLESNNISVSFDSGTVKKTFKENDIELH